MTRSDQINELAGALSAAQAEMTNAARDGSNPHFHSTYSTLAAIWAACRGPLTKHQLSIVQSPTLVSAGDGQWVVQLETLVLHSSGQFLSDAVSVPLAQTTVQTLGSSLTYLRRYALLSFVGLAPAGDVDDDGEAATTAPPSIGPRAKKRKAPDAAGVTETTIGKVASVTRRPLPSGKEKLVVKLRNDGREFETWSTSTALAAKTALQHDADVELVFKAGQFGLEILQLRDPSQPEPPV